jgi:hypothetical protein
MMVKATALDYNAIGIVIFDENTEKRLNSFKEGKNLDDTIVDQIKFGACLLNDNSSAKTIYKGISRKTVTDSRVGLNKNKILSLSKAGIQRDFEQF